MSITSNFTAAVKQHWADMFQENLEKGLVGMQIVKEENIPNGTTKNLPYINYQKPVSYTKYTAVTSVPTITGNDTLVITDTPMVPFEIDQIDIDDNYLDVTPELISEAGYMLRSEVDGAIMNQGLQANNFYNNDGLNVNVAGAPVALSLSSGVGYIPTVVGTPKARLKAAGVDPNEMFLVIDSEMVEQIEDLKIEKGFATSDAALVGTAGYRGNFKGIRTLESNNLTAVRTLAMATNPTAGDTVTFLGNVFTYVASIGTTPGNILIGANVAATRANTIAAFNGAAGAGTTYVAIADQSTLAGVVASSGTNAIVFTSYRGRTYASSNLTATSDKFGAETVYAFITAKGAIRLALRDSVQIKQDSDPDSLVYKFKVWSRFGLKTPTRGKAKMCYLAIQGAAAE